MDTYIRNKLAPQISHKKDLEKIKNASDSRLIRLLELTEVGVVTPIAATHTKTTKSDYMKSKDTIKNVGIDVGICMSSAKVGQLSLRKRWTL